MGFGKENEAHGIKKIAETAAAAVVFTGAGLFARFNRDFRAHWVNSMLSDGPYCELDDVTNPTYGWNWDRWSLVLLSRGTKNLETIGQDIEEYQAKRRERLTGGQNG